MYVFFLTDIEKSTEKWDKYRDKMNAVLVRHDALVKNHIIRNGGEIVKHTGDGFFAVFEERDPLSCAISIQRQMEQEDWEEIGGLRIRIGMHAGEAEKRGEDYFGEAINRAHRIMNTAWGGQIVLTPAVKRLCSLPANAELQDLGVHVLRDLGEPQQIYGLTHPDLKQKEFPPLRTLSVRPHNLPVQTTPFINRVTEVDELCKLIDMPKYRLISVIGPGGFGKTRLVLQTGAEKIDSFSHGVYFVPLDSVTVDSIDRLVFAIANAISFAFYSQEEPKKQLVNYLKEKEILIIMDNFEHCIDQAELLSEIMENAPQVKFLIASRERLRLTGEWIYEMYGFDYPGQVHQENIQEFSSIELFVQSAQRVQPDFALDKENAPAIAKICQLVEGTPLGIELAASWVRTISCKDIVLEIEKGLDFLTTTLQDVPERHRSLRAVFDHSWELLSDVEKDIIKHISVFQGGFSRDAAEHIAHASLQQLTRLVDKSLIRRTIEGRYEMLQVLQQFAREQLKKDANALMRIQKEHCHYYAHMLSKHEVNLYGGKQEEMLKEFTSNIDNIRIAWRWAVRHVMFKEIGEMLDNMYLFYERHGWFKEGAQVFGRAVEIIREKYEAKKISGHEQLLLAKLESRWGGMCQRLARFNEAQELLEKSLANFYKQKAYDEIIFVLTQLGINMFRRGEYKKAHDLHQESLRFAKKRGSQYCRALSLNNLAIIAYVNGDYKKARKLQEESLDIRKKINDKRGMAASLGNLANIIHKLGDSDEAGKLYQQSLVIAREIDDRIAISINLSNLGMLSEMRGEYDKAKALFKESLEIKQDMGDQLGIGVTLERLASVMRKSGDLAPARTVYKEALEILLSINAMPALLSCMGFVVRLYQDKKQYTKAYKTARVILDHPATSQENRDAMTRLMGDIKKQLSRKIISSIDKEISSVTLEDVVNEMINSL